jgi:GxxExxY protein
MKDWTNDEELQFIKDLHTGKDLFQIAKDHDRSIGEMKTKLEKTVCDLHEKGETNDAIKKLLNLETEVIEYILKKQKTCNAIVQPENTKVTMHDIGMLAETIYDILGPGFSERVYHNAMEVLLRSRNIPYESERIIPIPFEGHVVGNLRADIIINNETILEFKAIKTLNETAEIQCHNYLRLTGLKTAYLINFPPVMEGSAEVRCIS